CCVAVGPTRLKGFAKAFERDRIDRVELEKAGVRFKKDQQSRRRLLQTQRHARRGITLSQLVDPLLERFGRSFNLLLAALAAGHLNEVKIDFAVGTIQAD